ncbi:DUF488 domain-containing protein [Pseudomonas sp. UBA6323]|uniref:DUF488 domain-containing protein n=1 Tax=Pseudomonas sp. UBA6323 TaxID=1947329 RepID=UPI0025D41E11|nr:DUF488 family protein [Pseudomonas sp. UBA6323]
MIQCKRVYLDAESSDGQRVLVDRLWPRGLSRDALALDEWLPDVAPSSELRKSFAHRAEAFDEFRTAYRRELTGRPEHWQRLLHWARSGTLTLLYAARDEVHNNARVLAEFLEDELQRHDSPSSPVCYQGEFDGH